MKWNWFSPLPPAESGISDYTADLLPLLAAQAEITLWTNKPGWDPRLEEHAEVRVFSSDLAMEELNKGGANFYHVGNNPEFHAWIWNISRRHPGIVVLHDLYLQHLFYGICHGLLDGSSSYLNIMSRFYGKEGRTAGLDLLKGLVMIDDMAQQYPLSDFGVDNALGVVVHTAGAMEHFKRRQHLPMAYVPLPYDPKGAPVQRPVLTGEEPVRLVLFGHIHPNRRLASILEALACFPLRQRLRFDVYGDVANRSAVDVKIRSLKLEGLVNLHGFVPDQELDQELGQCALAFNLRHPTMGESSLSQLRYWSHSLPTLVTPSGWYGTLPEDVVGFVSWQDEVGDIHRHLHGLLSEPAKYREMGAKGRRYLLQNHSSAAYVNVLRDFAATTPDLRVQLMARQLSESVGRAVGNWGLEEGAGGVFSRAAAKIIEMAVPAR